MKDISGTYRDTYTYEGKTYAFVDDAWIGGVYYDKDMFEANGLTVPETYDEFLNICKTFYDQGIRPVSISGTTTWKPEHTHTLWYTKPATVWMTSTLPLGNGQFGACVMGGVKRDEVQFNEKTLWIKY